MNLTSEFERPSGEETRREQIVRYATGVLAAAVAVLLWWGGRPVLMADVLSVVAVALFAAAALVATWIAGTGPGITAIACSAVAFLFLAAGPQHTLALIPARDIATVVASTVLSAFITIVVARLRASHSALMQGLPEIERRARDRANEAAARKVEEERRKAADAKEDVADMQRKLQHSKEAASAATRARAEYLATTKLAANLSLSALGQYGARLRMTSRGTLTAPQLRDVESMEMCDQHVATLLDEALSPVSVEAGTLVPKITDVALSEVVPQALALVEPLLEAHGSTADLGSLDVPRVRADPAILVQVLARLVLEEALASPPGVLRLEAKPSGDSVTLECQRSSADGLTIDAKAMNAGREQVATPVWSALAAPERLPQMGGSVTRGGASRFAISLSTRAPSESKERSTPVVLWPPVAFQFP